MTARRGGIGRAARIAAIWAVLGFIFAVFLAAAAPLALGDHSYVLRTGSMSPTIDPGDVEVVQPIGPLAAKVGDIVAFRDPQWQGRLVSHRVRAAWRVRGRVNFITQGDANTGREHWSVPADGTIGRVIYRVPKLGYVVAWLGTPEGRVGVIVLPAVLLMASLLARLWRRQPDGAEAPDELGA
jgi:signal peptidase